MKYLKDFTDDTLPQNVLATLEGWQEDSKKIIIRKATILETNDPYLLEELKSYKTISRHMERELKYAVEIE